mmetsp:Transcript_130172/g.296838  ORF Transcript_130172/g.296838 Transcript_130172/m.296838 type:complete len:474 (+) Transcript_130172:33-1454(+)
MRLLRGQQLWASTLLTAGGLVLGMVGYVRDCFPADSVDELIADLNGEGAYLPVRRTPDEEGLRGVSPTLKVRAGDLVMFVPNELTFSAHKAPAMIRSALQNDPSFQAQRFVASLGLASEIAVAGVNKPGSWVQNMVADGVARKKAEAIVNGWFDVAGPAPRNFLALDGSAQTALHGQGIHFFKVFANFADLGEKVFERAPDLIGNANEEDSLKAMAWGFSTMVARALALEEDGPVLIPAIDLLNHVADPSDANVAMPRCNLPFGQPGDKRIGCGVVSLKEIKPGEPLKTHYGPVPNMMLLLQHGFFLEDNPIGAAIDVESPNVEGDPALDWLRRQGCTARSFKPVLHVPGRNLPRNYAPQSFSEFVRCFKAFTFGEAEFTRADEGGYFGPSSPEASEEDLERWRGLEAKTYEKVLQILRPRLADLKSKQDDRKRLSTSSDVVVQNFVRAAEEERLALGRAAREVKRQLDAVPR